MVTESGFVSPTAFTRWRWVSSDFSANASYSAETIACSISAPLKPSAAWASASRSKPAGSRRRRRRWISKISRRSGCSGRSTKKISSNRPLRSSSGGSASIRFAVATTKTGAVFSCSQVRSVAEDARGDARVRAVGGPDA